MSRKTALITGATDGIGKALALKLLDRDWEVVILGRSSKKCVETVQELKRLTGRIHISALEADLSSMQKTKDACDRFLAAHTSLDLLVLNANAIANERIVTAEGNEQNFAIGYLSRILMLKKLEETLANTQGSQILSVIGLDVQRLDFEDITIEKDFNGRKGLTRWQWAMNLFVQDYAATGAVPINLYMPGLVKTKILSNEPQPMRAFVKIMNLIIGLTPQKAADNMLKVLDDIAQKHKNGATYAWAKERSALKLDTQPGDLERLEGLTKEILRQYL
jgi:NAD(P)-dependent dehydrogenase (short-subunit alcohol dehydrogenase family)